MQSFNANTFFLNHIKGSSGYLGLIKSIIYLMGFINVWAVAIWCKRESWRLITVVNKIIIWKFTSTKNWKSKFKIESFPSSRFHFSVNKKNIGRNLCLFTKHMSWLRKHRSSSHMFLIKVMCQFFFSFIGILIFLLLRSPCKIKEPYLPSFW